MLRVIIKADHKETHPPSVAFAVMGVEMTPGVVEGVDTEVTVSVHQLQEMLRRLWRLLPPEDRPTP